MKPLLLSGSAFGILLLLAFAYVLPDPFADNFDTAEGLEVTTVASEPMLIKPTNLTVDEKGRVWVLEGHNYRVTFREDHTVRPEGDRIVILEDTTGDGVADKETTFYQGRDIDAAMGIAVLGDRIYVSAYENMFIFQDTTGDDVADSKEVFLTAETSDHDHSTHAFVFGLDGKIYWNTGDAVSAVMDASGNVIVDKFGNEVTEENFQMGKAFRMNEDGSEFEVLGYNFRNPYELTVDSYGTVWQSDNDDDGFRSTRINYMMEYGNYGYRDEITRAGWRTPRVNLEERIPDRHWHQNDPGVVPNLLDTGAGSPSGIVFYEGDLLPAPFRNEMIHAEPLLNVVRAYPVENDGAGYSASTENILLGVEDQRFRPVDVAVAPDGSLFIADWYDPGVGGHNVAIQDAGRIYRVAPEGAPYAVPEHDFESIAGAIEALESPNQSVQYRAWHRLHDAGDEAEPALDAMYRDSDNPRFRARALWLLTKIPDRGDHWVREALADDDPNIRITGIRAARQLDVDVLPYVELIVEDHSPQVRREAAIALRGETSARAAELWTELALQHDGRDRWYLEALGIGAIDQWDAFFTAWEQQVGDDWNTPGGRDIIWRSRSQDALPHLSEIIVDTATTREDRPRYFRALDFHDRQQADEVRQSLLAVDHPDAGQISALALNGLDIDPDEITPELEHALDLALEGAEGTRDFVNIVRRFQLEDRVEELAALALSDPDGTMGREAGSLAISLSISASDEDPSAALDQNAARVAELFGSSLNSTDPAEVRPALTVLGHADVGYADSSVPRRVLRDVVMDESRPETIRREAVRMLGSTLFGERDVLSMVREGTLSEELQSTAAAVLFSSYEQSIREEAGEYLERPRTLTAAGTELPSAGELARRTGDVDRGEEVFQQLCQTCHQVNGQGIAFGPDLSEIGDKLPKEALYSSILNPNAGITFGYEGYRFELEDGDVVIGYVETETPDQLVVRSAGGVSTQVNKAEIASREELDESLMPPGLEAAMTEQQLVDLVEYLASLRRAGQ